jgi:hypothetical protein
MFFPFRSRHGAKRGSRRIPGGAPATLTARNTASPILCTVKPVGIDHDVLTGARRGHKNGLPEFHVSRGRGNRMRAVFSPGWE